jgi:hypothetical protein
VDPTVPKTPWVGGSTTAALHRVGTESCVWCPRIPLRVETKLPMILIRQIRASRAGGSCRLRPVAGGSARGLLLPCSQPATAGAALLWTLAFGLPTASAQQATAPVASAPKATTDKERSLQGQGGDQPNTAPKSGSDDQSDKRANDEAAPPD